MDDLSTNTRRSELPRFLVYNNGYAFALVDRLVEGTGVDGKPAEYAHGKRGRIVDIYPTRATGQMEADRLNQLHPA